MIKVDDLLAVFEVFFTHAFQTRGPIDQQDNLRHAAHAAPNRFLAQAGAKLVDVLKTGNIGRGLPVANGVTLFIDSMLREDAAQIDLARFGASIELLAFTPDELFFAHRHSGAVGTEIHD